MFLALIYLVVLKFYKMLLENEGALSGKTGWMGKEDINKSLWCISEIELAENAKSFKDKTIHVLPLLANFLRIKLGIRGSITPYFYSKEMIQNA